MHWQIFRWPLRPTPMIILALWTLGATALAYWAGVHFWVGVIVGGLGLPLWYVLFSLLAIYAQKMLLQGARGLFDTPIESEADLNPFQKPMALRLFGAALVALMIMVALGPGIGAIGWLLTLVYPVFWLGVALEESVMEALNPKKAWGLLAGVGVAWPLAALPISLGLGLMLYPLLFAPNVFLIAAGGLLFLYAHAWAGQVLYWRRGPLMLSTEVSPEQLRASEVAAEYRRIDQAIHEMTTHLHNGNSADAIRHLNALVDADPLNLDPVVHERLFELPDLRLALEHALGYLQRLVERGESRKAWALMKRCLEADERFRPASDETLLALTRAAGREDAGLVNGVLADFAEAYPDSELIAQTRFRRARILIELLRDHETGVRLLRQLADDYPEFAGSEEYLRYRARLRPAG